MLKCESCGIEYDEQFDHRCIAKPVVEEKVKNDAADLKELVNDMPQVVPDAIQAAQDKAEGIKEVQKGKSDTKGEVFDPTIHLADDATGEPLLTPKTKRFRRKLHIPKPNHNPQSQGPSVDPLMVEAAQYTDTINTFARGILGDEALFAPGERDSHITAWFKVFERYGTMPVNPWVGVGVAYVGFFAVRAERPRTKSVLGAAFTSIKNGALNLFNMIMGKKQKPPMEKTK